MNLDNEVGKCLSNHEYYCGKYLKIITAKEALIPLHLNSIQKRLNFIADYITQPPDQRPKEWYRILRPYNNIDNLYALHKNIKANVLKARREGVSTDIESRLFKRFNLKPNVQGLIVAHNGDSVQTIFRMSKTFYKYLPPELKNTLKHNNRIELETLKTNSLLQIQKADEIDSSRSKGASMIHKSEVGFWNNAADTMLSLNQLINEDAEGTEDWNESTPNGEGGIGAYWYDIWQATKRGDNDRINIFFSWFDFEEYIRPFVNENIEKTEFIESVLSHKNNDKYGEEEKIMTTYNLTWEQMNWRRWFIRNKCDGSLNKFMQEYPEDDESCFLTTSNTFFSVAMMNSLKKQCREPEIGDLVWKDESKKQVEFIPSKTGFLKVWKKPDGLRYTHRYALGLDTAKDLEDSDFTCAELLDRINPLEKENVCEWHGHLRSDLVADELLKLSLWYGGDVWLCIEQQGEGDAIINFIRDIYNYLYTKIQFGKFGQEPTTTIGFPMNSKTKNIVVSAMRQELESGLLTTLNEPFIDECRTFTKGDAYTGTLKGLGQKLSASHKGRRHSKKRRFDDRVLAMALACEMARVMPLPVEDFSRLPKWAEGLKRSSNQTTYMGI